MQSHPPSIGNNVKLKPLQSSFDNVVYKNGFLNLKEAEPSLGIPSGYTLTQTNSVYYFPVFAISDSYANSRKFTGSETLTFVNKNLGYNTINPTYNIDISGTFHALSAYIENLSVLEFVPASETNDLVFNYDNVIFNTNVYINQNTIVNKLTAKTIFTEQLSANEKITTTIYEIFQLTGAFVEHDVVIAGNLTSSNAFVSGSIITEFLSTVNTFSNFLTANFATINNTLSVAGDLYANKIYGKINIDPFSQLYYNNKNELSINPNQNYIFAIRPSDDYSTDDINVPRTLDGDWWDDYGNITEDQNVSRPYFKNLQPVFDYIYKNGILGNNLTIYIDEDIIEGENKINYFTTDKSGEYAGCTVKGNLSAGFYTTEWLGSNYPHLTSAGIFGGDFLWGYDNNSDISGIFSYIDVPSIKFQNIDIYGRYEIGSLINSNQTKYYSLSGRRFTDAPRKISFRTYVCSNPRLPYGTFTNNVSTWNTATTKTQVQGRQISFKHDTNLSLNNLCFEFNTNSNDSTGLVFYDGQSRLSNITVSLLGNGIYSYGALNLNSPNCYLHVCGNNLGDPYLFNSLNWGNWTYNGYDYKSPYYYPGYGLAIIGNSDPNLPTIVNFGTNTNYTGFINVNNGAFFDIIDYNVNRKEGRNSYLQSSIILGGKFNANTLYQLGDYARIQGTEHLFTTGNLFISSRNVKPNNFAFAGEPSYKVEIYDDINNKFNFKYINFNGCFSTFSIKYYGYTNWTFRPSQGLSTVFRNSNLSIYNGNPNDFYYTFIPTANPPYVDISNALATVGHLNRINPTNYISESTISYTGISNLFQYQQYFTLTTPFDNTKSYTLTIYQSSSR